MKGVKGGTNYLRWEATLSLWSMVASNLPYLPTSDETNLKDS